MKGIHYPLHKEWISFLPQGLIKDVNNVAIIVAGPHSSVPSLALLNPEESPVPVVYSQNLQSVCSFQHCCPLPTRHV